MYCQISQYMADKAMVLCVDERTHIPLPIALSHYCLWAWAMWRA